MSDTQWPRYEVFKQEAPGQPHRSIGTVHAPDPEMALMVARDVHVRRPDCASLWVAPAEDILSMTADELAANPHWAAEEIAAGAVTQTYHVFFKTTQRRALTFVAHAGDVRARTPREALRLGMERFPAPEVFVWWVCPAGAVMRSEPGVEESWFAPARDKTYKQQARYVDVGIVRPRAGTAGDEDDPDAD